MTATADELLTAANEVAEKLIGTTDSLESALEFHDHEDLSEVPAFLELFDAMCFCCETCGWWCDIDEANDHPNGHGFECDGCQGVDPEDDE